MIQTKLVGVESDFILKLHLSMLACHVDEPLLSLYHVCPRVLVWSWVEDILKIFYGLYSLSCFHDSQSCLLVLTPCIRRRHLHNLKLDLSIKAICTKSENKSKL